MKKSLLLAALGSVFLLATADDVKAESPRLEVITVHCKIHTDNKEEPGSYHVVVKKSGKKVFEKKAWGLRENWDNGAEKLATGDNVADLKLPAKGSYTIEVKIDNGTNIDVDHEWWIDVEDSEGDEFTSSKGRREHWMSGVREGTYKVKVKPTS